MVPARQLTRHSRPTTRHRAISRYHWFSGRVSAELSVGRSSQMPMTLDELQATLPNGFHDSQMRELTLDFVNKEARLTLDVWTGDLDSKKHGVRENYQRAQLRLINLLFWISQPTDLSKFPISKDSLCIDIGLLSADYKPGVPLPESNPANPTYYLYSTDINTCFFFACQSASVQWS